MKVVKSMHVRIRIYIATLASLLVTVPALPQSSTATLFGSVTATAGEVKTALVSYRNLQTGAENGVLTNAQGLYAISALPPGKYSLRADAQGFTPKERAEVELTVGGRVEINFALEPAATAAVPPPTTAATPSRAQSRNSPLRGHLSTIYGPDAQAPQAVLVDLPPPITDTLTGDLSTVIEERKIQELPYSGRDVYSLLVLQPGVVSDSATGSGLGLAVDGQRVAGTNFLLDGVDNNDTLLTGPSARVSADAVQEYRMTTNNFSAEFGRATAFIANAITRGGGNQMHGTLFEYFNNDRLNANSFANNWTRIPRLPYRSNQFGGTLGGPVRRDRLFYFASFDRTYLSTESPFTTVYVPSRTYIASLPANSIAKKLLTQFRPLTGTPFAAYPDAEAVSFQYPVQTRNTLGLGRLDFQPQSSNGRLGVRYVFTDSTADNYLSGPYPQFNAALVVRGQNVAVNYTRTLSSGGVNEIRGGFNTSSVGFDRPHPEIPTMFSGEGVVLPGSPAFYAYTFQNSTWQAVDNFSTLRGRHSLILGGEVKVLRSDSVTSTARDGLLVFDYLGTFAADAPSRLNITVDRFTGAPLPDSAYERNYRQMEFSAFVQDNLHFGRVTVNLGLRWEYFGVPSRTDGPPDWNLFYGPGTDRASRLASATLKQAAPYHPDYNNFAPRFGFAYDVKGSGRSVVRGGYGIAFDRIFDNVWQEVSVNSLGYALYQPAQFQYTFPARQGLPPTTKLFGLESTVQVDETLRTPYGENWFVGLQQRITSSLLVQADYAGSRGRKLIALDEVNRFNSHADGTRLNPNYNTVSYRGNQGSSEYHSLQLSARQALHRNVTFQVSYTLGRTQDNQSDPFRNPVVQVVTSNVASRLTSPLAITGNLPHATFTQQFNSSLDWGASDFNQKHNLVLNVIAQSKEWPRVPWLTRGWQLSAVTGFRSGFPFSVIAPDTGFGVPAFGKLNANRANLAGSVEATYLDPPVPVTGGEILLSKSKFQSPASGAIGLTPRNAFTGPGFYNVDMGISRNLHVPRMKEEARLQIRADFFNILNHTNLGNPVNSIGSPDFGVAAFGRTGFSGALPTAAPLSEQPRHFQIALRLFF